VKWRGGGEGSVEFLADRGGQLGGTTDGVKSIFLATSCSNSLRRNRWRRSMRAWTSAAGRFQFSAEKAYRVR
jgi:hypothetical protein